tara:strand:+ start:15314 stop:15487 length:174 start_codon:yes stop_codon:yes gene_type:complete
MLTCNELLEKAKKNFIPNYSSTLNGNDPKGAIDISLKIMKAKQKNIELDNLKKNAPP